MSRPRALRLALFILGVAVFGYLVAQIGIGQLVSDAGRTGFMFVPIVLLYALVYAAAGSLVSRVKIPVVRSTSHKSGLDSSSSRTTVAWRPRGDTTTCQYRAGPARVSVCRPVRSNHVRRDEVSWS